MKHSQQRHVKDPDLHKRTPHLKPNAQCVIGNSCQNSQYIRGKTQSQSPQTNPHLETPTTQGVIEMKTRRTPRNHSCHIHSCHIHIKISDLYLRTPHLKPNAQDEPKRGNVENGALATQMWSVGPHKKWRAAKPSREQRGHRATTSEDTSRRRTATDETARKCRCNTHASPM